MGALGLLGRYPLPKVYFTLKEAKEMGVKAWSSSVQGNTEGPHLYSARLVVHQKVNTDGFTKTTRPPVYSMVVDLKDKNWWEYKLKDAPVEC